MLKLKAVSFEECDIISALLQDSILHVSHHMFHEDSACFYLLLNRFCWEVPDENNRALCGLYIYNVTRIRFNKEFRSGDMHFKNLLSVHAAPGEVNLLFSDHHHIALDVSSLCVAVQDLHPMYPTESVPYHSV